MNSKKIVRMMFLMCLLFGAGTFFCGTKVLMFDETHAMQISEYLYFICQIVAFFRLT